MIRRSVVVSLLLLVPAALRSAPSEAPALETGACSLEGTEPATVAAIDEDFELLLDDGRRAVVAGLEFPPVSASEMRGGARRRLADWLVGRDIFVGVLAASPDRWGRIPVRLFATLERSPEASLVSAGVALLEAGEARFRADPAAASCAPDYLAAEERARASGRGLWTLPAFQPVDLSQPGAATLLLKLKGMVLVFGRIRSFGESRDNIYLNFGEKRVEDFSVVILRRNLGMFARSGIRPETLIGRQARVRGLIDTGFGPRMQISTPAEIEILDASP